MRFKTIVVGSAAVALMASAAGLAQQPSTGAPQTERTRAEHACDKGWQPQPGSQGYWRWQAYHNLDCAVALIDERLHTDSGAAGGGMPVVTFPRDEVERLRALIRAGKDGAMRAAAEDN